MTEQQLLAAVIDVARLYGWKCAHFRPALTTHGYRTAVGGDGAGFPDLVLVRPGQCIAAELKSSTGALSPAQRDWISAFESAGISAYVWRPADFPDAILGVLQHLPVTA